MTLNQEEALKGIRESFDRKYLLVFLGYLSISCVANSFFFMFVYSQKIPQGLTNVEALYLPIFGAISFAAAALFGMFFGVVLHKHLKTVSK